MEERGKYGLPDFERGRDCDGWAVHGDGLFIERFVGKSYCVDDYL